MWEEYIRRLFPTIPTDFRAPFAHGFGRLADRVRGHRTSLTALEREEMQRRRALILGQAWQRMLDDWRLTHRPVE